MLHPTYSIVLPAYNEAQNIEKAVRAVDAYFTQQGPSYELIVVNDGSVDDTRIILSNLLQHYPRLRVISHPSNQGKGAAIRTGALAARGDWILCLDTDLSSQPELFKQFYPYLKTYDILIGSRGIEGSRILVSQPIYRMLAGKIFNLVFVRGYLHLPFYDTQCGFKIFSTRCKSLFEKQRTTGWSADAEILYLAKRAGFCVKEIPVTWSHSPGSKVRLRDFWKVVREMREIMPTCR